MKSFFNFLPTSTSEFNFIIIFISARQRLSRASRCHLLAAGNLRWCLTLMKIGTDTQLLDDVFACVETEVTLWIN